MLGGERNSPKVRYQSFKTGQEEEDQEGDQNSAGELSLSVFH